MRLQKSLLPFLVVFALAGCGDTESSSSGGGDAGADPAQAIPSDSPVYVEAVVRPEGDQGDNARELLGRFLGEKSVTELLDEGLREEADGKTYEEDIEPWLGQRIGLGVSNLVADEPDFVAAIAVTDTEAAETFVSETATKQGETYKDTQLYTDDDTVVGVSGDFILFSQNQAEIERAIDTLAADGLGDAQMFTDAMGELPEERLGAFYLDTKAFGEIAKQDPSLDPAAAGIIDKFLGDGAPITAALTAEPDAATIESHISTAGLAGFAPLAGGAAPELIADAPTGSFAVVGYTDVGNTLKTTIETFAGALGGAALTGQFESQTGLNLDRDLFSWVGDLMVFVRGDNLAALDGAVVIEATDEDAAKAAIPRIAAAARRTGAPVQQADIEGADQAFAVAAPGAPGPIILAEGDGRVVLAVGEEAAGEALSPSETIEDSGLYERAQDSIDGVAPATILDFASVLALAEGVGATDDPDYQEAKPYLEQLDLLAAGAEEDGDAYRSLFTVKVK